MGKRVLKTDLSVKGIENLKKQLIEYRDVELPSKCKELATKLANIGVNIASAKIGESPLGKYVTLKTDISADKMGYKAILIATGEVIQSDDYNDFSVLLAIEFGAGIHYNQKPNPKADEFDMGVGTFPGQIHAFEDGWFYWNEEAQEWRYTHGVKATMPMYTASERILQDIVKTAKEVFG